MNKLHVGFNKKMELPKSDFLLIDDDVPEVPFSRTFDIAKHSINPLQGIDYKSARRLARVLWSLEPQVGNTTLAKQRGRRALLQALLKSKRLDRIQTKDEEVLGLLEELFVSPPLKRVLCEPTNFNFSPGGRILVELNRAEIGEEDALVIGLVVLNHYKGQVVVPDLGFYGRDVHTALIRESRLIAGVNYLDESRDAAPQLAKNLLSIKDRVPQGCLYKDAVVLAEMNGLTPHSNSFNDFVDAAMT